MKIYGILGGTDYEGGGVERTFFKLKSDALMEANAIAKKRNEEYKDNYTLLESGDEWRDNYEYIKVIECELI